MVHRAAGLLAILTGRALFASPAEARATVPVSIANLAFNPATVSVARGGMVTWRVERPGSTTFDSVRSRMPAPKTFANPAEAGTSRFAARTRNTLNGKQSGWSPALTIS